MPNKNRASLILSVLTLSLLSFPAAAQDWFKIRTGLGVDKPRIAVADFAPRADNAKPHATLFTQTVREDLSFSGVIELVSPSFYPAQVPSAPNELQKLTWTDPPLNANFAAFGNLTESSTEVAIPDNVGVSNAFAIAVYASVECQHRAGFEPVASDYFVVCGCGRKKTSAGELHRGPAS